MTTDLIMRVNVRTTTNYHVYITHMTYHYAYARQTQVYREKKETNKRKEKKKRERKEKKGKESEKGKETKGKKRQDKKEKQRKEKGKNVILADLRN